jgi:voltage-gated potassium channel
MYRLILAGNQAIESNLIHSFRGPVKPEIARHRRDLERIQHTLFVIMGFALEYQLVPTPEFKIMDFTIDYLQIFYVNVKLASPLLTFSIILITLLGLIVGMRESWGRFDSIYWAFITATTVGYGDMRPTRPTSKALSVLIAFIGITFTGILVALAIYAATEALTDQDHVKALQTCIDNLQ